MDLYSEIILDYFKHPRNKGEIENPSATATEYNLLCGDKVRIDISTDANGKITDIKFSGEGCAISQAATSMLTEKLLGKTLNEISKITNEDIYEMLGIPISPARVKCAVIGLIAAKNAVKNMDQ